MTIKLLLFLLKNMKKNDQLCLFFSLIFADVGSSVLLIILKVIWKKIV